MTERSPMVKVVAKSTDVVVRAVAGETILVPLRSSASRVDHIFSLNPVATFIWERIDGHRRVDQLRDEVVAEYDVQPEEAEADVLALLEQLTEVGAITQV